jgi:hypothetical protein
MSENRVLRRIFETKGDGVLHNESPSLTCTAVNVLNKD